MTGSQEFKLLSQIIDSIIADESHALDDDLPDVLQDPEKRDEAIDILIKKIEFYREEL